MSNFGNRKQAGQVSVIVALSLVTLIGVVGFMVDSGLAYLTRVKLNAAVDAAVFAGAKAVSGGATESEQRAEAQAAALRFFQANYPPGSMGSTALFPPPEVTFDAGMVTINASASATVPTTLMGVLGFDNVTVGTSAQAVRRDLDLAFVVDVSGSLFGYAADVRKNARLFVSNFDQIHDRLGLVVFSTGAKVLEPMRTGVGRGFDLAAVDAHLAGLTFGGFTNSSEAFWRARDQLNRIGPPNRSKLRAVVFFSDGAPTAMSGQFTFKNNSLCRNEEGFRRPGVLAVPPNSASPTESLFKIDAVPEDVLEDPTCYSSSKKASDTLTANALPQFYNAHPDPVTNVNLDEFHLSDGGPRIVTDEITNINVDRVARNLVETMAAKAREEGIYVLTIGLGYNLTEPSGPDNERGDDILKCMANAPDAKPSCVASGAGQPVGMYCYAADITHLKACYTKVASAMLRLTR